MILRSGGKIENTNDTINTQLTESIQSDTDDLIDLNKTFIEKIKMNTLSFETAIKMLPTYNGDKKESLTAFEKKCEFIFNHVDQAIKPAILEALITNLTGDAFEIANINTINTFIELKNLLRKSFDTTRSVAYLQTQLNNIEQGYNESVTNYAARVQKAYIELSRATNKDESSGEALIMNKYIHNNAKNIFEDGLKPQIRMYVRSKNLNTLEEMINVALEEEQIFERKKLNKKNNNNYGNKNNYNDNNFKNKNFSGRQYDNKIKCYNCNKFGHISKNCRNNNDENNKIDKNKPSTSGTNKNDKFCYYCKKNNHVIENCRKLKHKKEHENKNEENQTVENIKSDNVHYITEIENDHITGTAEQLINNKIKLYIDTGSSVNIIKFRALKGNVIINVKNKTILKGIDGLPNTTVGSTCIDLNIKGNIYKTNFQVVKSDFAIPDEALIGKKFIKENNILIDLPNDKLIFPDIQNNSNIIPARSEKIIAINIDKQINEQCLIVHNSNLTDEVILVNTINEIKNNQLISSVINISEEDKKINDLKISELKWEPYKEITITEGENIHYINDQITNDRINELKNELRLEHLNQNEKNQITDLCFEFSDIFLLKNDKLPSTSLVKHEIITPENITPINVKPYRLPEAQKTEINRQIEGLEKQNIIQKSSSPWNSPLLVVQKRMDTTGIRKFRVCVDYRKLNKISVGESYPLNDITEILDNLGKAKYYSTLDLASGYHAIEMEKSSIPKTAFSTSSGKWEWLRMPFGLKNAPSTFSKAMRSALSGLLGISCFAYLDDFIVYSNNLNEHIKRLKEIFLRLRKFNLRLQPIKCEFLRTEVCYLGHIITEKGVKPNPIKINAVKEFPRPTNTTELKGYLGLTGYYRRFIKDYAEIAKPLTTLLKKDKTYNWTDLCEHAFLKFKTILTNEPILKYPDFSKQFILTTDASNFAISGILSQGEIGKDLPICYASRTLNETEIRYSTIEKEALAIVHWVKHFRPYLWGKQFLILTDHKPLEYLFNIKDVSSKLIRWRLKLEEYDYIIKYKAGKLNSNADALSRIKINNDDKVLQINEITDKTYKTFM